MMYNGGATRTAVRGRFAFLGKAVLRVITTAYVVGKTPSMSGTSRPRCSCRNETAAHGGRFAMSEQWKPVVGYESLYVISESGIVRSKRAWRGDYHEMTQSPDIKGYLRVGITDENGHQKSRRVHILVAEAFIGPRPEGLQLNHKDGNKINNHWSNLEYVTASENSTHAVRMGLRHSLRGVDHKMSKLTEEQVLEIRRRYRQGDDSVALAKEYGIDKSNVWMIATKKTWKHLE